MNFSHLSDDAVLNELGQRIAQQRLNANIKQAELAHEAGVSRKTLSSLENGNSVQLDSFIRIMRALSQLDHLDALLPPPEISPIAMADLKGKSRQRASTPNKITEGNWIWPS